VTKRLLSIGLLTLLLFGSACARNKPMITNPSEYSLETPISSALYQTTDTKI